MIAPSSDCEALAALHKRCFDTAWDAQSFAQLLSAGAVALVANENEVRCGFILTRVAADEAEILSLGVPPGSRRRGLGKALVSVAAGDAAKRGANTMFLEVSAENRAALTLYKSVGFTEAGHRRDYYGAGDDAIVLRAGLPLARDA